jgi:hypothetical protein
VNEADGPDDMDTAPTISSYADLGPVVAWMVGPEGVPNLRDIVSAHWTGSAWSAERTISIPDSVSRAMDEEPEIAMGPDGMAWASWKRWGPWPKNPDYDIWAVRGQVYPPVTAIGSEPVASERGGRGYVVRAVPNPTLGIASIDFFLPQGGDYEAIIADTSGG